MREEYSRLDKAEMSIWECCELLNDVVDESDPDLDEPQIMHLLQSAEAIRKDYPNEDWLHLTALIHGIYIIYNSLHDFPLVLDYNKCIYINITILICLGHADLGKILLLPQFGGLPQWSAVGELLLKI